MASLFSKIGRFLGGRGPRTKQVKTSSPFQDELLQLIRQGLGGEGQLGGALGGFDPEEIARLFQTGVADPARRQFEERTMPGIEQRAIASGVNRSSGLQGLIGEQQGDLETQLSELLARQQLGAREGEFGRQLQGIGLGLGTPTQQTFVQPGKQGFLESLAGPLAGLAGRGLGGAATGFFR